MGSLPQMHPSPHTRTAGEARARLTPGADMHFAGPFPSKRLARSQPRPRRLLLVRLVWPHGAARDREEVVKVPLFDAAALPLLGPLMEERWLEVVPAGRAMVLRHGVLSVASGVPAACTALGQRRPLPRRRRRGRRGGGAVVWRGSVAGRVGLGGLVELLRACGGEGGEGG